MAERSSKHHNHPRLQKGRRAESGSWIRVRLRVNGRSGKKVLFLCQRKELRPLLVAMPLSWSLLLFFLYNISCRLFLLNKCSNEHVRFKVVFSFYMVTSTSVDFSTIIFNVLLCGEGRSKKKASFFCNTNVAPRAAPRPPRALLRCAQEA